MTETELTHCVLIGMGSGVTAPLGLLSHFTANRPDVWTSFIFVSRNLEMIGESLVVLRQICKQRMPRGGIVLYWTAKDEFPDVRLLNAIRLYLETGEESERETLNKAFAEWLRLARLFFGRKRVADLLETEEGETLMYNWTAASLNCLIALLKNSILHESFRNPLKNCILQQGRPCWSHLNMRLSISGILRESVTPLFSDGRQALDRGEQKFRARKTFCKIDALYTGGKYPLQALQDWAMENNAQALGGSAGVLTGLKALWKVHGEVWG